jgi:hypothetical protein
MAAVGVHVERTVRFLAIGTPWKYTIAEVEVRAGHGMIEVAKNTLF